MTSDKRALNVRMVHLTFRISLIFKGLFAFSETLAGFMLIYFTPSRVRAMIDFMVNSEAGQTYIHFWQQYLMEFGYTYTVGTQLFAILYLISHGVVKYIVVVMLWQERLWAYPFSILMLLAFIAYQVERYQSTHSIFMVALTVLDIVLIALTVLEFWHLLDGRQPSHVKKRRLRKRERRNRKRQNHLAELNKYLNKWHRQWDMRYRKLEQWILRIKKQS